VTGPEQVNLGVPSLGQVIQHSGRDSPMSSIRKLFVDCGSRNPLDPSNASGEPSRSPIPSIRRSPLPGSNSANLTDELPELSTNTNPPELRVMAGSGIAPVVGILGTLIGASGAWALPRWPNPEQCWPSSPW
jgi:hypothetical protein